jgi:hypothetical protein
MAQGFGKYLLKALGYGVFGVIFFGLTASAFASATLDLPRMDSNHDKVIQSRLVHDGCAIVAMFSDFRAAVCPSGPSSSQLIEEKQRNLVLGM